MKHEELKRCTLDRIRGSLMAGAAVNHDGDSDSAGSVCGNIMGAIHGYEAIMRQRLFCPDGKALEPTLELSDLILALADDLFTGCSFADGTPAKRQWEERYCKMMPAGICP